MNASVLLFGILPLIVFVIIDSFSGLKAGIVGGILFALAECIYTLIEYKTIDELTLGSTALILFFGFLSYKFQKDIYFKLQPVVVGLVFSIVFFVMQYLDKPLLVVMLNKYQFMFPEDMRSTLMEPAHLQLMKVLSGVLAWGFLIHATLVAFSAFRMNKWWWLVIRGIGFYLMLIICVVVAGTR